MAAVDIGRLRLRGPPDLAARTAFLIEDACRTAIPDSERLILVRRLDLGRTSGAQGEHPAAVRRAYEAATAGAVHGGDDGGGANCVWFASRAEARRLLLAALLAGRTPTAWYWRLAVPGWSGQPLDLWLGLEVALALDSEEDAPDLAEIVTMAVEAGAADALLAALDNSAAAFAGERPPPAFAAAGNSAPPQAHRGGQGESPINPRETLRRLRERMPQALAAAVEAIVRRIGGEDRPAFHLLERLLVRASPSLALSPTLLRELAACYRDILLSPTSSFEQPAPSAVRSAATPRAARVPDEPPAVARAEAPVPDRRPAARQTDRPAALEAEPAPASAPGPDVGAEPSPLRLLDELYSPAAGLWLAVPSLIRMGFREWLAGRPELLCADPGRALVRAIARHHRVPPDDPALLPLEWDEEGSPDWALLWRVGLDRWLRRRTRISLSRLVWRSGWIRIDDERLTVRFAPGDADIRLRRRALDIDPGWTDWLGLSVRYAFSERPAP